GSTPTNDETPVAGRRGSRGVWVRSAGDLAGLEAAGADVEALRGAVDGRPDALDVGVEATLRDLARPRTVVAEARLLGADVADGSHRALRSVRGFGSWKWPVMDRPGPPLDRAGRGRQPHKSSRGPGVG